MVWRARGVAAPPAAPTRRRSSRGGVDAERFGSRGNPPAGEISEIAPSIFVRTRSTAPEHPAHIIATFKTIGSLMAASVRSRTTGRKCPCGSSCAAEPRAGV